MSGNTVCARQAGLGRRDLLKTLGGVEGGHAGLGLSLEAGQCAGVWRQGPTLWIRAPGLYILTAEGRAWPGMP